MEEWFLRFFQNLQLQLGLRDPKLTAPEKNLSGIFLETDTGENIDILLLGKDGHVEELRGRTPAEELVRFASLDFAEYHAVIQRLWIRWKLSSRQRYSTSQGRVANVQSGLPCAAQRHSHSASHDLPIFGAPASRCSPWGSRSSTTKETGS